MSSPPGEPSRLAPALPRLRCLKLLPQLSHLTDAIMCSRYLAPYSCKLTSALRCTTSFSCKEATI